MHLTFAAANGPTASLIAVASPRRRIAERFR